MGTLQLNSYGLCSLKSPQNTLKSLTNIRPPSRIKIRAVGTVPAESKSDAKEPDEPPSVNCAFVHSVLLPDGSADIHFRTSCGGKNLRDIMLDSNIELYGPYSRPLLNCAGGGTCATCMVEIIMGKELLNPRTDKEKEKLKKKPKNWRLACQTTVGNPNSTGMLVVQQLPEWKAHEWKYEKALPPQLSQ
ncbi:photosynthetic NDH subunit of subcomplex B 3, chloroplastic [Euphorbia lathyris]|uniref:photosynthetic NDH subunit of subcomplex B 3, chloroplastic n=1 Tax=Euphorbia lathyris TaxID=212925 RepID=UPI003313AC9D